PGVDRARGGDRRDAARGGGAALGGGWGGGAGDRGAPGSGGARPAALGARRGRRALCEGDRGARDAAGEPGAGAAGAAASGGVGQRAHDEPRLCMARGAPGVPAGARARRTARRNTAGGAPVYGPLGWVPYGRGDTRRAGTG